MRVTIVTESYPPDVNGVAHSVQRTVEHLLRRGHEPRMVAPASVTRTRPDTSDVLVVRIPSVGLPGYPGFRGGVPAVGVYQTDVAGFAGRTWAAVGDTLLDHYAAVVDASLERAA